MSLIPPRLVMIFLFPSMEAIQFFVVSSTLLLVRAWVIELRNVMSKASVMSMKVLRAYSLKFADLLTLATKLCIALIYQVDKQTGLCVELTAELHPLTQWDLIDSLTNLSFFGTDDNLFFREFYQMLIRQKKYTNWQSALYFPTNIRMSYCHHIL